MSCYLIYYKDGAKMMRPINPREEYMQVRDSESNRKAEKRRMVQMCYSCLPNEDGTLKGSKTLSNTVGMDIDILRNEGEGENEYQERLAAIPEKILAKKDELGLMMMEQSATKGYHIVFKRHPELTQKENLRWASDLLDVVPDKGAVDHTRVFFCPADKLIYLDDGLFETSPCPSQGGENANDDSANALSSAMSPLQGSSNHDGAASSPSNHSPLGGEGGGSLPYSKIIPAFFQMECQTYPDVPEGTRNDTIFTVCAKYLRYCTDHSFSKMKRLLWPEYAFGLSETEMDSILRSALSRERSLTPKTVKYVLSKYGNSNPTHSLPIKGEVSQGDGEGHPYRPLADCIIDEALLPLMPRWMNVLLRVAPPGYKFITLASAVPAMMTLLTDVTCKFGTKKVTRLNGWTHVDGPPASNKSICLAPIPVLMKPLQDIDDANQAREDAWYEKKEQCVNKKEQPPKPKDIVIRILPANTTRHQHIRRMFDAKGKHTYTYCEEVQSLDLANRASYSNRSDFMQLLFDNGMTGNQSMHAAGMRCRTQVAWNLSTSGTRDQTLRTWGNCATNGATTRVFFCLVPDNSKAPMPQYVQYTEQDEELIHRAAQIMMEMQGLVHTPKLDKALCEWVESVRVESIEAEDNERLILKNRSADIAHKFGVVIHLAWMVQHIMDTEDREQRRIEVRDLDLNELKERQYSVDMALYAVDQCLDGQYRLWARRMKQQLEAAYEGTAVFRKSDRQYTKIPDVFTYSELMEIFPGSKINALRKMVERFKSSGTVVDAATNERGEKVFRKV